MLLSVHYCYLIFTVVLSPQRIDMERATQEAMESGPQPSPQTKTALRRRATIMAAQG